MHDQTSTYKTYTFRLKQLLLLLLVLFVLYQELLVNLFIWIPEEYIIVMQFINEIA